MPSEPPTLAVDGPLYALNVAPAHSLGTSAGLGGGAVFVIISLATALLSQSVTVGADTMWLVALGNSVIAHRDISHGIPFLATDTSQWVNVPVAGEVLMAILDRAGSTGLIAAQVITVTIVLVAIALSAARLGARGWGICLALALLVGGQLASFGIVRAQMWSLPLFVAVAYLLRREWHSPSRRIWLAVPLTVVWGNLHGAVLVGVAVIGSYLLLGRLRRAPFTAVGVGAAVAASLWLTPAGVRSHEYYLGVMSNVAAERGEGLWASVNPSSALGILLISTCAILLVAAVRRRLPLWEYAVIAGLTIMTVQSARHGVWLALWLAPIASLSLGRRVHSPRTQNKLPWLSGLGVALCMALVIFGLVQRSAVVARDRTTAAHLASVIGQSETSLAVSPISELLAVEGTRLWASNPIDALSRDRQAAFLDFLSHNYSPALGAEDPPDVLVLAEEDPVPDGLVPSEFFGGFKIVPTTRAGSK